MAFDVASETPPTWARVDIDWYMKTNADLLLHLGLDDAAAAERFYHEVGVVLGHSPNPYFDESWYLDAYPDVARAVARGVFASGFEHYGLDGHRSRAPHWLFSEQFYLSENIELTKDYLDAHGYVNGYDHYLRTGDQEFRSGHWLFDPAMHQAAVFRTHGEIGGCGEFARFLTGDGQTSATQRLSWYFDPEWYLQTYPEVAADIEAGLWSSALEHYICNHRPTEFDPNEHFSEEFYRSINPDIAAAITDGRLRNGYDHFMRHGAIERRQPHSLVDLHEYFRSVPVQTEIEQGYFRDAFAHFRSTGGRERSIVPVPVASEQEGKAIFAAACQNMLPALVRNPLDFRDVDPRISVIVVAHNKFAFTLSALASLRANFSGPMQVILVDSGSRDEINQIENYVRGVDIVRFRHNVGFVTGCNAGLERVRAEATLFLNNDVTLNAGAVQAALTRLWASETTGAVGAKVIRTHGKLQEAGSIVWRDGSTSGYLRDEDPNVPEANFVRPVDFCSGAFLLVKTKVLRELGGFDVDYSPAYFEEVDLCIRMSQLGYKTVYEPAASIQHFEYATTDTSISVSMMERNRPIFKRKNAAFLRRQPLNYPNLIATARAAARGQRRILLIEDRLPFRRLGSGFSRSNDVIHAMAGLGHHVTVFPIYRATETIAAIYKEFPDTVEAIYDRELADLATFLSRRSGYFDAVWIARTHNVERLLPIISECAAHLPIERVVLDTEALAATRTFERRKQAAPGVPTSLDSMVEAELAFASVCQRVVAVNELDAAMIREAGFENVDVLGHMQCSKPSPKPWGDRKGLLFLGAIHDLESPNLDGLRWFISEVLPILDLQLPLDVSFAVAGYRNRRVDLSEFGRKARVKLLGPVDDPAALYDEYRVFVAPARFAAGIPYKVHEAAAHGIPVVATQLLCRQVGWQDGVEIFAAPIDNPSEFAAKILRLYNDEQCWQGIRDNALAKIAAENSPEFYRERLSAILDQTFL